MTDLSGTIVPKSDQLNADDLITGPRTIRVTKVALLGDEQPVAIHFEGDGGKPYKPGKSMRRVLVHCWGSDGNAYAGRSMTIFRDEKIQFGGMAVGGIRISHLSHIDRPVTMALTETKARRKPFTVQPLRDEAPQDKAAQAVAALLDRIAAAATLADMQALTAEEVVVQQRGWLAKKRPDLGKQVDEAVLARVDALTPADEPESGDDEGLGLPAPQGRNG